MPTYKGRFGEGIMPITLENVDYIYAPGTPYASKAVNNLSLTIEKGEFVGIMGKTGSGKSTLIQLISGLLTPETGKILLDGKDINEKKYDRSELRRKVGVVFQFPEYQLFESTVEKDVAFGIKRLGWSKERIRAAVKEALSLMGFEYEEVKEKSPLGFSGGEKRRIAIAGVLATDPDYIILDEPIAGLDPIGREDFLSLIDRLHERGKGIIMISHNADALAEHAERILILKKGTVAKDGTPQEIFANVRQLKRDGIGVCQAREVAQLLQEKGFAVPDTTIYYEQLLDEMIKIGRGQRG